MNIKDFIRFCQQQKGITSIEYGLISCAVAVFVVFVLYGDNSFSKATLIKFEQFANLVKSALLTVS
ncbi:fimbrial protein [Mannheimia granulomatis]|uniref:Flp family type IVb pilin n=1 Tax=Mannheimia granulomatis TaxID=85402 RepID=UPI00159DED49|nr:Flp family type IVb pilin [Mannheimia granulomatis]QLB14972.1 fimbrial protein [Mannheimia granulomatis]